MFSPTKTAKHSSQKSSGRGHKHEKERDVRRRQRKVELRTTYESILKALDKQEYTTVSGESLKPFLKGLFYYSAGDRTRPIPMFKPAGAPSGSRPILYPEGMKVSNKYSMFSYEDLEKEYGDLVLPDDDAMSSVVSMGTFAEEDEYINERKYYNPDRPSVTVPQPRYPPPHEQRQGLRKEQWSSPSSHARDGSHQMRFGPEDFETRMSTPVVTNANAERRFFTNGQPTSFGKRHESFGFAD